MIYSEKRRLLATKTSSRIDRGIVTERARLSSLFLAIMVEIPLPTISQSLGASVVLAIVYYAYWQLTIGASRRRIIRKHGCKPVKMYPSKDPIFGSDTLRKTLKAVEEHRLLRTSFDRFQTMGNTFQMNLVGTQLIFTIEPEILKTIMSLKFKDYSLGTRRKISMTPVLGEGIFTTDGAAWQHSRDMLRPNFNRSQVGDLPMFETHVSHLIQAIPKDGSMLDLQDLFFQLTIDSATEFLFGESTNCLVPGMRDEKHALFAEKWNKCLEESAKHARTGFMSVFYSRKEFNKNIKFVHEYVEEIVDRVLEQEKTRDVEKSDGRYIFLHELVKQTKNVVELRSELLNILLAGRDTTASLLSNVWFEIARRPDIWAKMRAEVDALNGEKPTFDQIKEMKYIRWVLNECTYP